MTTRPAFIAKLLEAARKVQEANEKVQKAMANDKAPHEYRFLQIEWEESLKTLPPVNRVASILELARYIEEIEAERNAARNVALEEAAVHAGKDYLGADAIRAMKGSQNG